MTVNEELGQSLQAFFGSTLLHLFWYVLWAGALWLFFCVVFKLRFRYRKVIPKEPTKQQISREFFHSVRSMLIFGVVATFVVFAGFKGWTQFYIPIERYGWVWFFFSIIVMVFIHDAYFYWTHRLMHHPRLYRLVHRTHHLSTSPTSWAAYAFSPIEAVVQAGIAPVIIFTIPTQPVAFIIFMSIQIGFNVFGHCGYEIFSKRFIRSPLAVFLNTVTHHSLHHEKFHGNYGLYFNIWDRLMGTNQEDNAKRFEEATRDPSGPRT